MRIVQLNPYFYPFMGGIEHRIHNVAKRLASRHEVIVLTSRLPGTDAEERRDGYLIRRLDSRYIDVYNPPYVSTRGVGRALADLAPDLIDLHYRWAPSYTKAVRTYRCARIYTLHNTYGEGVGAMQYLSLVNDWAFKRHVATFDRIVCVSQYVMHQHLQHGYPKERMVVVPNGVDMPPARSRDEGSILSLGRLVRTKGLDFLVEAMSHVNAPLIVCGAGPDRERLERKVHIRKLDGQVRFLGRVSEEKKREMFASCSLFVMPSLQEAYGIAAAEAMSYGKAVVTTSVGGLPEVVDGAGLLVPPRDPIALAAAMNRLLEDAELRYHLGRMARERAMQFSWDRTAAMLERIYEDLVA